MEDHDEVAELPPAPAVWSVAAYLEDRQYGGPEEGGWWFDAGEVQLDLAFYQGLGMLPLFFMNEAEAFAYMAKMNAALDAGPNVGRPSTSHSNSRGRYVALAWAGLPPPRYPDRRPHYE